MLLTDKALGNKRQFQQQLQASTIRNFDGGLNLADTDLNMQPKFARTLDNIERSTDGTLSVRAGTKLLSDLSTTANPLASIVNMHYFNGYLVVVTNDGLLFKVLADGSVSALQIGALNPWAVGVGALTQVNFAVFNSDLIIVCGQKKPLIIPGNPNNVLYNTLQYLVDAGSGSNVNTPVGTFVCAHSRYTIMAGFTAKPSVISISYVGTSGTYFGDSAPNDAVEIDVGQRVSLGNSAVTGLASYKEKLLVFFERGVLPMNLGIYTGSPSVHTPTDDGFIQEFGCLGHRTLQPVGDDCFFLDNIGVNSIIRVAGYNTLRPTRASYLIDTDITSRLTALTAAQIQQYVFSVFDMKHKRYMLFIPVFTNGVLTESICYSYTNIPSLKIQAWARLRGWTWSCSCRSSLQNVFFGYGLKIYYYNFDDTTTNADFVGDTAKNADGTGVPVSFTWELPWADFDKRTDKKRTVYLAMDTQGLGSFTAKMYVDNILTDRNGTDAPALATDFQGGSAGGYGLQHYGNSPYGGGRPTADERLFAWPAVFKIAKLVFTGSTKKSLKFISVSLTYMKLSIRR